MKNGIAMLCDYQARLAAQDRYGVLMCWQALDAGGKDGTIRHVMSGVNPQGVHVTSFRQPSAEELDDWERYRAAAVLTHVLIDIDPQYPEVSAERRDQLLIVKGELEAQAPEGAAADPFTAERAKENAAKQAKAREKAQAKAAESHGESSGHKAAR